MRVLLTGATGFIGPEIARRLLERADGLRTLRPTPARLGEQDA